MTVQETAAHAGGIAGGASDVPPAAGKTARRRAKVRVGASEARAGASAEGARGSAARDGGAVAGFAAAAGIASAADGGGRSASKTTEASKQQRLEIASRSLFPRQVRFRTHPARAARTSLLNAR